MKKIIGIFISILFIGCSSTGYESLVKNGFRISKADKRFEAKSVKGNSYYKTADSDGIYLILEKNRQTGNITPILNLEYQGDNWIYMEEVKFISDAGDIHINFLSRKFEGALTEEKSKFTGKVEERIAFSLTTEEIIGLEKVLTASNIDVIISTRYREQKSKTKLTTDEVANMRLIIQLYNK